MDTKQSLERELDRLVASHVEWDSPEFKEFRKRKLVFDTTELRKEAAETGLVLLTPGWLSQYVSQETGLRRNKTPGFDVAEVDVDHPLELTISFNGLSGDDAIAVRTAFAKLGKATPIAKEFEVTIDRRQDPKIVGEYKHAN